MGALERNDALAKLLRKKQVPIVTLDAHWHQLFPETKKSDRIKKLETEVNTLLKRQGQATNDLQEMRKLKARLMQNIVDNMESASGEAERTRGKRLDKSQKLIKEAREKIDALEYEEMVLPQKLKEANWELVAASVEDCNKRLEKNVQEITEIAEWVSRIREELKEKLIIKQELESENALIYATMHDMLGREIMEYFDARLGEE